ncbi:MAG: hypothetical protein AAF763_10900 [Pseudomonadota bacterium]
MTPTTQELDAKASETKAKAQTAAEDAKSAARDMAGDAQAAAGRRYDGATDRLADGMRETAGAVHEAAADLPDDNPAAPLLRKAAGGVEQIAKYFDDSTLTDLGESVQAFARRNPVGFLAAAGFAGFAASRFATAERRRQADEEDLAYLRLLERADGERQAASTPPAATETASGVTPKAGPSAAPTPNAPPAATDSVVAGAQPFRPSNPAPKIAPADAKEISK